MATTIVFKDSPRVGGHQDLVFGSGGASLTLSINETVSFLEDAGQANELFLNVDETLGVGETSPKNISSAQAEAVAFAEDHSRNLSKQIAETLGVIDEGHPSTYFYFINETLGVTETSFKKTIVHVEPETLGVAENMGRSFTKAISESWNSSVAMSNDNMLFLNVDETFGVTNTGTKKADTSVSDEALNVQVDLGKVFNKSISETVHFQEDAPYRLPQALTLDLPESLAVKEVFRRASRAAVSDILVGTTDLTESQFALQFRAGRPVGFGEFAPFVPGIKEYQHAAFKAVGQSSVSGATLAVTELKVVVDLPDVFDSGSTTVTTSGAYVAFSRPFIVPPEVVAVMKGGAVFGMVRVHSVTTSGFTVELVDASGTQIAGAVSWSAHGI